MKRLLLVEDEPGLVLTLTDRLAAEGYAVETSSDGARALERASSESFDLVILDVMLPRMNGLTCCGSSDGSMSPRRSFCSPRAGNSWTRWWG